MTIFSCLDFYYYCSTTGQNLHGNELLDKTLHDLGSIGGVQAALKKLRQLDLIEKDPDSRYQLVDPIFRIWLQQL